MLTYEIVITDMMAERGDTELETRVKIAEMDITLQNVGGDVSDMKKVLATVATEIVALGKMQGLIARIQDSLNINTRRSDERWNDLLATRREDMADYKNWRKETDDKCAEHAIAIESYRAGLNILRWVCGIAIVIGLGMYAQYATTANADRLSSKQDQTSTDNRLRSLENTRAPQ